MTTKQTQMHSILSGESFFTSPRTADILIQNAEQFRPSQHRTVELNGLAKFEVPEPRKPFSMEDILGVIGNTFQ